MQNRHETDDVGNALEDARRELQRAVGAVPEPNVCDSLEAVADAMPVALSVDCVNARLLGSDERLHLVAASGFTSIEIRKRAFQPLALASTQQLIASGGHARLARSLGIEWSDVAWMARGGDPVGTLAVGARTRRRPTGAQVSLFHEIADRLAVALRDTDRHAATLRACSMRLARSRRPVEWPPAGPAASLRPRERTVLELYADGLSTGDIATLLVISPHTVRTHVKLALRRLGVHTRDEAAAMVRSDQVAQLI